MGHMLRDFRAVPINQISKTCMETKYCHFPPNSGDVVDNIATLSVLEETILPHNLDLGKCTFFFI